MIVSYFASDTIWQLKFCDLMHQIININVQGIQRRKTELQDMKNDAGKYFAFYLYDTDNTQVYDVSHSS